MDHEQVVSAMEPLRTLLRADGGDFELVGVDAEAVTVHLRLLLADASCAECVMPRPYLEEVATNMLRRSLPDLRGVAVDDPREAPTPSPGA